ncbi:MAG: hypothetical protein QM811_09405 [Pirellulales bacterium]
MLFADFDWSVLPQLTIDGLTFGALIALIALGYTMVYGIIGLINFAHGEVFMLGAFFSGMCLERYARSSFAESDAWLWVAIPLLVLATGTFTALVNRGINRVIYRPLRNAPKLAPLVSAIGVSFVLQNVGLLWAGTPGDFSVRQIVPNVNLAESAGLDFTTRNLAVVGVVIPLMLLLIWLVLFTKLGKAMRAVQQNQTAAELMGIPVESVIAATFTIGGALAGAGRRDSHADHRYQQLPNGLSIRSLCLHRRGVGRDRQHSRRGPRRLGHRLGSRAHDRLSGRAVGQHRDLRHPGRDPHLSSGRVARSRRTGESLMIPASLKRFIPLAALIVAVLLPAALSGTLVNQLTKLAPYVVLGLALNVVVGYAGILHLGIMAFFTIGVYAAAIASSRSFPFEFSFPLALTIAVLLTAASGLILGSPTLRLRGDYLALVTLGFGEMIKDTFVNLPSITNGIQGIKRIPAPTAEWWESLQLSLGLQETTMYFINLLAIALVWKLLSNLESSRWGRALTALREDEIAAASTGLNEGKLKLSAFAPRRRSGRIGRRVVALLHAEHQQSQGVRLQQIDSHAGRSHPGRNRQSCGRRVGRAARLRFRSDRHDLDHRLRQTLRRFLVVAHELESGPLRFGVDSDDAVPARRACCPRRGWHASWRNPARRNHSFFSTFPISIQFSPLRFPCSTYVI